MSNSCRKRGKEDVNRNVEFQDQGTLHKGPLDNDREEHASPSEGQQDKLEGPPKKKKVKGEMEATTTPQAFENTSTFLDNGVKKDNVISSFQNNDKIDTLHNIDHGEDEFYVENEVSGIKMINEQDPPNTSDFNTQNEENPSSTETPDIEMKPDDADHQSTADVSSSAAEVSNQSGTSDINSLPETPVSETPDTQPIMDKQSEEDNYTPAEIRDIGITRSTSLKVSPEQPLQRSSTWPNEVSKKVEGRKKGRRNSKYKSLQNNMTSIQIRLKPEEPDILSHQRTDPNTETEAKPSQSVTSEEIRSSDGDNDSQSKPNISFRRDRVIFTQERMEPHETTHNDSDSDIDDTRAQYNSLLQETTVSRRKIPLWVFLILIILCLVVFAIICILVIV